MTRRHDTQERTPQERRTRLYTHSVVFVVVNAGLTTLNLIRNPDKLWFYWPLFGWGLGLVLHAWIVYQHRDKGARPISDQSEVSGSAANSDT